MIRKVRKGQKIFSQDDKSKELYYIKSGSVIIQRRKDGETIELAHLKMGAVFGEMAIIDGKNRSADAVACQDAELVVVSEEEFNKRMAFAPAWYLALLRVASERLREVNERLNQGHRLLTLSNISHLLVMIIKKARKENVKGSQDVEATLDMKVVKKELIDILGINQSNLKDSLGFLEQKNMILQMQNKVTVADVTELQDYANFLKSQNRQQSMELIDDKIFFHLVNLKNIMDTVFAKTEVVTFSLKNFRTEMVKNMKLPENKTDWFLEAIQKMKIVKFILSKTQETTSLEKLGENGQLRFNSIFLGQVLREEGFKRLGL